MAVRLSRGRDGRKVINLAQAAWRRPEGLPAARIVAWMGQIISRVSENGEEAEMGIGGRDFSLHHARNAKGSGQS